MKTNSIFYGTLGFAGIIMSLIIAPNISDPTICRIDKKTRDLSRIDAAIRMFYFDQKRLPDDLFELVENETRRYIDILPKDPWMRYYVYNTPVADTKENYEIMTLGQDGIVGGDGDNADFIYNRKY